MSSERQFIENQILTMANSIAIEYTYNGDFYYLLNKFRNAIRQRHCLPLGKTAVKIKLESVAREADYGCIELITKVDAPEELRVDFNCKDLALYYAIKTRHEGSISALSGTIRALLNYINCKNYQPITEAYCLFVKEPILSSEDSIIVDVYVGISPNTI